MTRVAVLSVLFLIAELSLAQSRAVMSTPRLESGPDEITLTASFSGFDTGAPYRIGVGARRKAPTEFKLELTVEGESESLATSTFSQGHLDDWFQIKEVTATGFAVRGATLQKKLNLKLVATREDADRIGKFFIFVSKKYGPDTWYVEDGAAVDKSVW